MRTCPTTTCCALRGSSPLTAPTPCSRSPRWGQLLAWPTAPRPLPGLDPSRRYHVRLAAPAYPELRLAAGWMAQGVTLPGSYLTTTGLALPVLHPDHLVLLRVSAVD